MNVSVDNGIPPALETDLTRLFAPRSVALVGATDHPTNFGGRVFRAMLNFGYAGKVYPVNPRLKEIYGLACYPGIKELPETPDHVGIIVATERVFDVLADCAARRVPFATVYTAGFAETATPEGRERQARLIAFARASGMRIMGPNCNGVINFIDSVRDDVDRRDRRARGAAGNVGVISHSGGLGQITVMWRAQMAGLGVSYEASCGNEADLDTLDFARFMLRSDTTDIILMAIEGFKDGAKLEAVAREALEREKPIVVLKLGRTEAGSRAASSHTGAIAGVDDIYQAAFRQYGLIGVNTCNELYETAILLRKRRWPKGRRRIGRRDWRQHRASRGHGRRPGHRMGRIRAADPGRADGLVAGIRQQDPEPERPDVARDRRAGDVQPRAQCDRRRSEHRRGRADIAFVTRAQIETGVEFVRNCAKPAAMIWVGACTDDTQPTAEELVAAGVPVYRDALPCLRAIRAAADFGQRVAAYRQGTDRPQRPAGISLQAAREKLGTQTAALTEREAKHVLAEYGFPVTRESLARNADEAVERAREIAGSVALKIDSADIPHKTDAGAIKLGLQGDDAVRAGYAQVMDAAARHAPNARINGVLVQEMVPQGVEMMLGVIRDPVFGPVVAVGLGGIHIEVLRDVAYRVAPVTPRRRARDGGRIARAESARRRARHVAARHRISVRPDRAVVVVRARLQG